MYPIKRDIHSSNLLFSWRVILVIKFIPTLFIKLIFTQFYNGSNQNKGIIYIFNWKLYWPSYVGICNCTKEHECMILEMSKNKDAIGNKLSTQHSKKASETKKVQLNQQQKSLYSSHNYDYVL